MTGDDLAKTPLPSTVEEAVTRVLTLLSSKEKCAMRDTPEDNLTEFHFDLRLAIGDSLGLSNGQNKDLIKSCVDLVGGPTSDESDVVTECLDQASIIIKGAWNALWGNPMGFHQMRYCLPFDHPTCGTNVDRWSWSEHIPRSACLDCEPDRELDEVMREVRHSETGGTVWQRRVAIDGKSAWARPSTLTIRGRIKDMSSGAGLRGWRIAVFVEAPAQEEMSGEYMARVRSSFFGMGGVTTGPDGTFSLMVASKDLRRGQGLQLRIYPPHPILLVAIHRIPEPSSIKEGLDLSIDPNRVIVPRETSVELHGYYLHGFEQSYFVPCPGGVLAAHERPPELGVTWVEFSPPSQGDLYTTLMEVSRETIAWVHWRGLLIGPGGYGHLGTADHKLLVEEILEAKIYTPWWTGARHGARRREMHRSRWKRMWRRDV